MGRRVAPQGRARLGRAARGVRRVPARGGRREPPDRAEPPRVRRDGRPDGGRRRVDVAHPRAAKGGGVRSSRRETRRRRARRRGEGAVQRHREGAQRVIDRVQQQRPGRDQGVRAPVRDEGGGGRSPALRARARRFPEARVSCARSSCCRSKTSRS